MASDHLSLWEAFGRAEDRDIMVLNLDAFEERAKLNRGCLELTFIVFNNSDELTLATLTFPSAGPSASVATGEFPRLMTLTERRGPTLRVELQPQSILYLRIADVMRP